MGAQPCWPAGAACSSSTLFFNSLALFLFGLGNLQNFIISLFVVVTKVVSLYEQEPLPTMGWLWNNIDIVHGNQGRQYLDYSNALDCLSAAHVSLQPPPYCISCNVVINLL